MSKKFTVKTEDDSVKNLLDALEKDERYAEQARAVNASYQQQQQQNQSYSPKEGNDNEPTGNDDSNDRSIIPNTIEADVAALTSWPKTDNCSAWTPSNYLGVPFGVIVYNPHPLPLQAPSTVCCFCKGQQVSADDPIFNPCNCKKCHRSCFKKWRQGWINPRNYWSCPECMYNYKIERISQADYKTSDEVRRDIRCKIGQLWAAIVLSIAAAVSIFATIAWAADRDNKNVPVFIKSVLTSVAYGFPNANSTRDWREEFKQPDVSVVQYYGLLGALIVSIIILIISCFADTGDKKTRSGKGCCDQCYCRNDSSSDTCFWCCYWTSVNDHSSPTSCNCDCCNDMSCDCCSGDGCDCDGGGGGCDGDCDCKMGDMGEAAAIILVVVVVIVLISAIFVAIGFAVRKSAQLHDSIATTIEKQAEEFEGSTIVFGVGEFVRPTDQV